eukprot:CAMPEP_0113913330 /NCGR_PEP_ID=MMETSP0780_2-20120614/29501_1 /TAXON_ID=652834 /ORGANISM="Palpitomonas bilix" /LENGTH=57 /DNA_ID=CAMNT_0000910545 /DNA_START=1 /DNA_END=171 /DNA_ORIENTATION=- /assembly_acc=CAM_ASM_000599
MPGHALTVVISPLLALMQDQVYQLDLVNVLAATLSSADDEYEKRRVLDHLRSMSNKG